MSAEYIGRYEVEKRLGAGSMAVVYKAVDPLIGRTVAIKTIRFDTGLGFENSELRERFFREAKSAGILNHPNIVTIYDIGTAEQTDFIVMEFVEGESLHEWLARNPVPPVQQTAKIIEQIAAGLDYAASNGIIHRDIKPANILLTSDLTAKIADFGIAKAATSKLTQTGAVIGSPSYMSPEQAMGQALDGRSDIFSLGIIFYEMLTGEKPFSGTNPSTIIYKILHQEPVKPQQLNVTLHPALNEIVARMLAKDPEKRYQNCSQLIRDLKNYPSMTLQEPGPSVQTSAPAAAPAAAEPKRNGFRTLVISIVVLAALAGGYYFWSSQRGPLQDAETAPDSTTIASAGPAESAIKESRTRAPEKEKPPKLVPEPAKPAAAEATQPEAPAAETIKAGAKKEAPVADTPAEVRVEFAGTGYPVTVYDGAVPLKQLSAASPSTQIAPGIHRFRLSSDDGFLDQAFDQIKLVSGQVYTIPVPALSSAFIEVTNDGYDGCVIQLNGKTLSTPYPVQIPKLPAANYKIVFRWSSGKYAGREIAADFSPEGDHHYRVRGEPSNDKVFIKRIR